MDRTITASDLMTPRPARVRAEATLDEALAILQELDVRHLPVVDEDGQVIGMLSDRDFRQLPSLELPPGPAARRVAEVMSSDVAVVERQATLGEMIDLLLERKIGALPVVDADGVLEGIVSYVDVLRRLRDELYAGESATAP